MKDKEKQIEEKADCFNCVCKPVCMKTADIDKEKELISWNEYVKQYGCHWFQRILPEDSVVLSREEYDAYHKTVTELTIECCQKEKVMAEKILDFIQENRHKYEMWYLVSELRKFFGIEQNNDWVFGGLADELNNKFGCEIKE